MKLLPNQNHAVLFSDRKLKRAKRKLVDRNNLISVILAIASIVSFVYLCKKLKKENIMEQATLLVKDLAATPYDKKRFFNRIILGFARIDLAIVVMATTASVTSFVYFYGKGLTTAFGDAQTRLIMSRLVVDAVNPGIHQLGGIWPPLPQLGMLPFVWNDTLYKTGIAGAIFPMMCFVLGAIFMYKLVKEGTGDRFSGLIGVVAYASGNVLFMQSVPMSEMPFIVFMIMSIYYLLLWERETEKFQLLFLSALAIFFATWTRYEGWILFIVISMAVVFVILKNRFGYDKSEAYYIGFCTMALLGVVLWLAYNAAYFHDPLYFFRSDYAPWAIVKQTLDGMNPVENPTGDLGQSFSVYFWTMLDNAGPITASIAGLGAVYWLVSKRPFTQKIIPLILLFPFPFFVLVIYQGQSVGIWHPNFVENGNWGTRYGTLMLPAIGFFVGFLVKQRIMLKLPIFVLVIASSVMVWQNGIISSGEAVNNQNNPQAEIQKSAGEWIGTNYDRGLVLLQRYGNEHLVFTSGLPLGKVVYEGSNKLWEEALTNPQQVGIDWIIATQQNGKKDAITTNIVPSKLDDYERVYEKGGVTIFKRTHIISISSK